MDAVARTELNVADAIKLAKGLFADHHIEEALPIFQQAATHGGGFDAINGLGMCLSDLDRYTEALACFDQGYRVLHDEMMALMANRAKALCGVGRVDEALAIYDGILKASPNILFIRYSRALVLLQAGQHEAAIEQFNAVLEKDPTNDVARFARGFAELVLGDYERGFKDYECRLKDDLDEPDVPLWTGAEDLTGKTILVHGEMGLGDNIMFMRFVPMLLERGAARVVVVLPESQYPLVPKLDGVSCANADHATWPKLDCWIRFMSLALAFRVTLDNVPGPVALTYDAARTTKWRGLIHGPKLKVGLCWSGSPKSKYDAWRSVPLNQLAPLFQIPRGVQFYSFQKGVRESDRAAFVELPMIDLDPLIEDFGDTAHAMRELDLMITVDTSVAHMAGTVGVPTFVMLTAFRTYWLWITKLITSPWYPSVRVFRQEKDGDWSDVVAQVQRAIVTHRGDKAAA